MNREEAPDFRQNRENRMTGWSYGIIPDPDHS
jgi:hypothetical protein